RPWSAAYLGSGSVMKMLFLAVLTLIGLLVYGLFALVDEQPELPAQGSPDLSQVRLFLQNRDPRRLDPGEAAVFTVEGKDLEMLLDYALQQWRGGTSMVTLREGEVDL